MTLKRFLNIENYFLYPSAKVLYIGQNHARFTNYFSVVLFVFQSIYQLKNELIASFLPVVLVNLNRQ